jgi:hypothetical protein
VESRQAGKLNSIKTLSAPLVDGYGLFSRSETVRVPGGQRSITAGDHNRAGRPFAGFMVAAIREHSEKTAIQSLLISPEQKRTPGLESHFADSLDVSVEQNHATATAQAQP